MAKLEIFRSEAEDGRGMAAWHCKLRQMQGGGDLQQTTVFGSLGFENHIHVYNSVKLQLVNMNSAVLFCSICTFSRHLAGGLGIPGDRCRPFRSFPSWLHPFDE